MAQRKELVEGKTYKRKGYTPNTEPARKMARKVIELKDNGDVFWQDWFGYGVCGEKRFRALYERD